MNEAEAPDGFRSGFVALVGRPNVGKSTLLNQMVGEKVSITAQVAQTTRHQIQGVYHREGAQVVFVDTPGITKPRSALSEHLNRVPYRALDDVDVVCFVVDGYKGFGKGDRFIAEKLEPGRTICILNKVDTIGPERVAPQLTELALYNFESYFCVSGFTGKDVAPLLDHICNLLPFGPRWFPDETLCDKDDGFRVAELVREQLLRMTTDELPHSITTRLSAWEWPRVTVEIIVERESQKPIVIGTGGQRLKKVGSAVRSQMADGAYLELIVKVEQNWQNSPSTFVDLGYE